MFIGPNTLEAIRLDGDLLSTRNVVWEEGLSRVRESFFLGSGLLTKQTKGGSADVDFSSNNYDVTFDAHSLLITLTEQGGVLLLVLVTVSLLLPLWNFLRVYGVRASFQSPEFLIMSLMIPGMFFVGGDMISLGNLVNRLQWLFLGILAFDLSSQRSKLDSYPLSSFKSNS